MFKLARPWIFAALLLLSCSALAFAEIAAVERETRSAAGFVGERDATARRDALALETTPKPLKSARLKQRSAGKSSGLQSATCCAFRIYSADTALFDDFDGDGYYTYLRVIFDIDTDFFAADVYANVYVAPIGEPWELVFESEVFTIFGSSSDDEYEVDTEFVAGYPPGEYDVLIDVYDAQSDELVATLGPEDSSALSYLPIEDISYDSAIADRIVISDGGGGSTSLPALLLLAGLAVRRFRAALNGT
jgi:hypothetical protein